MTAGCLAVALDDSDVAGRDEGFEKAIFSDGGFGVAFARSDDLEVVAGELKIVAGDHDFIAEDGGRFGVSADGFGQPGAFDDGGWRFGRRLSAYEPGARGETAQSDEKKERAERHLRRSGN